MKTTPFLRFAAMAALVLFLPQNARAQGKKQLQAENLSLRKEIEKLRSEVVDRDAKIASLDSIIRVEEGKAEENLGLASDEYTPEISDSLLRIWYATTSGSTFDYESLNMENLNLQSDIPDQVYVDRLNAMHSFIPLPYNEHVRDYIVLYTEKRRTMMGRVLGLGKYYMPIFEEAFNRHGLPHELKAMAVIESALNPVAVSRAGATGIWQFMYATARRYDLNIDSYVDERMDVEKAVDAAARYLRDAYQTFGDWNLAIASYNCGPGNVMKAIRRSGGKTDFWDIYDYLPRETRGYVPAFIGALYAMTYYKEHGIVPQDMAMPSHIDTLHINKMLHFKQLNDVAGVPYDVVKSLNPQYFHDIVPGSVRECVLKVPYRYVASIIDNADSIYRYQADSLFSPTTIKKVMEGTSGESFIYVVKSGDSLGKIASRYHCTVAGIKKWNGLKSDMIRTGQKLRIYRGRKS